MLTKRTTSSVRLFFSKSRLSSLLQLSAVMASTQSAPIAPEFPEPVDKHVDDQLGRKEQGEGEVELVEEAAQLLRGADLSPQLRV